MPKDFIPKNNTELLAYAQHNSALLTASGPSYGVATTIATAYAAVVAQFETAVAAATGDTRSRVDVLECAAVKENLVASIRSWARLAQAHPGITTAQRAELGISLRDAIPTPVNAPTVKPGMEILSSDGRLFKMRVSQIGGEGKAKLPRSIGAMVYSWVGTTPEPDMDKWVTQGLVSRGTFFVELPVSVPTGSQVWFRSCWITGRGLQGPLSNAISAFVAGARSATAPRRRCRSSTASRRRRR